MFLKTSFDDATIMVDVICFYFTHGDVLLILTLYLQVNAII